MTLQSKIKEDVVIALKNKELKKVSLLKVVIGECERMDKNVSNEQVTKIIRKMHENAVEQKNLSEIEILEPYLPKMYSEQNIRSLVANIIEGNGFKGMSDMGKVMGVLSKHPDKALIDNRIASGIVKELLV